MMGIVVPETYSAYKKYNKIISMSNYLSDITLNVISDMCSYVQ